MKKDRFSGVSKRKRKFDYAAICGFFDSGLDFESIEKHFKCSRGVIQYALKTREDGGPQNMKQRDKK